MTWDTGQIKIGADHFDISDDFSNTWWKVLHKNQKTQMYHAEEAE